MLTSELCYSSSYQAGALCSVVVRHDAVGQAAPLTVTLEASCKAVCPPRNWIMYMGQSARMSCALQTGCDVCCAGAGLFEMVLRYLG